MNIYISHTVGCSGWNMPEIYKGTNFKIASRTRDFLKYLSKDIQMLDWDFRGWEKNPEKIEQLHLQIVKDYDIETVMSMDLWEDNIEKALIYANLLQKYANRVLIPIHYFPKEVLDFNFAYPNANWFDKNIFPPFEYRNRVKHILGGSPQSQIKLLTTTQLDLNKNPLRFKNVESIDGNQIFNVAIRAGKEWYPTKPYWRKPKNGLTNEEIFKNSVKRLDKEIKKLEEFKND